MTARAIFLQFLGITGVLIFAYYILINANYLFIHIMALLQLRDEVRADSWEPNYEPFTTPFLPGVAIVVPAYNEAGVIVESVQSLLNVNYPDKEIVVVNDGSTDATLDRLKTAYELRPIEAEVPFELECEPVQAVYRSVEYDDLTVIDKMNGGKSDALNAGIWLTDQELFAAIDADSLIDRDGLLEIVRPFLEYPRTMVAVGGTIRVANNCEINHGRITDVNLDRAPLVAMQAMEYLRAFYSGRLGLSRIKGLILISGAFGVFQTEAIREIGGYRETTITEDFDLLVRLHREFMQQDRDYDIEFLPQPVMWTEVPESRRVLSRQRRRWYRGMVETLWTNRRMIGNPKYGRIGVYVLPFFTAAEMFGPLIEGLGYLIVPLAMYFGVINWEFFIIFFIVTTGFGVFLSWFGVYSEVTSFRRYDDPKQILRLLGDGILENFGYRQWKTLVAWRGLFEYLRGDQSWGVMERAGFDDSADQTPNEPTQSAEEHQRPSQSGPGQNDPFIWGPPRNETKQFIRGSQHNVPEPFIWGVDPFIWGVEERHSGLFIWGPHQDQSDPSIQEECSNDNIQTRSGSINSIQVTGPEDSTGGGQEPTTTDKN